MDTDGEGDSLRPNITRRRLKPPPPPLPSSAVQRKHIAVASDSLIVASPSRSNASHVNTKLAGSIRVNPLAQHSEGLQEANINQSIIELVETADDEEDDDDDDDMDMDKHHHRQLFPVKHKANKLPKSDECEELKEAAKAPLFRNLSIKFKKVASISFQKFAKSQHESDQKEADDYNIIVSPDLKSRTSISARSCQPGSVLMQAPPSSSQSTHTHSRSHSHHNLLLRAASSSSDNNMKKHDAEEIDTNSVHHSHLLRPPISRRSKANNHTYSLSMDQLHQLQHGLAVQTGDGIRLKVDKSNRPKILRQKYKKLPVHHQQAGNEKQNENGRGRVLSLIKTYNTRKDGPYTNVRSQSSDRYGHEYRNDDADGDFLDDDSSASHESMYIEEHENHDAETDDGGYTTPTIGSSKEYEVNQGQHNNARNMSTLPEEGLLDQ